MTKKQTNKQTSKKEKNYFYSISVYFDTLQRQKNTPVIVAIFKTFTEAEAFVINEISNISTTSFDTVEIHKFNYGAIYNKPSDIYTYKLDRITNIYFLTEEKSQYEIIKSKI